MLKNEIIKKLDSLSVFSKSLPDKTKADFIQQLEKLKNEISQDLANMIEGKRIFLTKPVVNPQKKSLMNMTESLKPALPISTTHFSPTKANVLLEITFKNITKMLIPKLTEKGRKKLDDFSTPINLYTVLKIINERSSIFELFQMYYHKYNNFLEFMDALCEIEDKKYIGFIKVENFDDGWIMIGEILKDSGVIHKINLNNAINYKKGNKGMLIGEAMIELRFITEEQLSSALKIQNWLSKLVKDSIYFEIIDEAISIETSDTNTVATDAANIMDFIIPVLNDTGKVFMATNTDKDFIIKLSVIDETSSLLKIFEKRKKLFNNGKLEFFKFILKLDSQELLSYKKNDDVLNRTTWIRFGEIAVNLEMISPEHIEETFKYRQQNSKRKLYIGEALVELNHLKLENLDECLKIQRWCNTVLAKISYETSLITSIKEVLEIHFNSKTEIGRIRKLAFNKPMINMVCITYTISGKLNGQMYYIFDRNFAENLTKTLMATYGVDSSQIDESIILEICNIITGSSLTKLSKMGIFCETNLPKIQMEKEIYIANKQVITILPLMNQYGRFIVGFQLKG